MRKQAWYSALATNWLVGRARSASSSWPPTQDGSVFWFWQSSIVVGNWLYIDSGEYYPSSGDFTATTPLPYTISVDLSSSWDIATIKGNRISKPGSVVQARKPNIYYDSHTGLVNRRGGWPYFGTSYETFYFKPDGKGGGQWTVGSESGAPAQSAWFGSAFAQSENATYMWSGGHQDNYENIDSYMGVKVFADEKWSLDESTDQASGQELMLGGAVFVSNFGLEGLLVVIGGDNQDKVLTNLWQDGKYSVPMSLVNIFDIHSGQWYGQNATGDVPPGRAQMCVQGLPSDDGKSYEIFMFGGARNSTWDDKHGQEADFIDVFILSLPAFKWVRSHSNDRNITRRASLTCQHLGNGQMLAIGGSNPSGAEFSPSSPDTWTNSMNIYDMAKMEWTSHWDADAKPYARPAAIQSLYDSGADTADWNSDLVSAVFQQSPASPIGTVVTSSDTSSSSSDNTGTTGSSSSQSGGDGNSDNNHTGAIAGGVVGGVVGLALIGALLFWLLRRRRRAADKTRPAELHDEAMTGELPSEHRKVELPPDDGHIELPSHHGGSEMATPDDGSPASTLDQKVAPVPAQTRGHVSELSA